LTLFLITPLNDIYILSKLKTIAQDEASGEKIYLDLKVRGLTDTLHFVSKFICTDDIPIDNTGIIQ
jgi:hypothetical protein